MRIGVLGTGQVGSTLGTGFLASGHDVRMGSRTDRNEKAAEWAEEGGERAGHGTFADVAGWAELVVNATGGLVSLEALTAAGAENLAGKVLLDAANPLDWSNGGFPPAIAHPGGVSLGEQIQQAFPEARVVKTLNTMNIAVMTAPRSLPGAHTVFVAGDDADAKAVAFDLLRGFGWESDEILDLGGIEASRGLELYLPLWLTLMRRLGTPAFNVEVVRG